MKQVSQDRAVEAAFLPGTRPHGPQETRPEQPLSLSQGDVLAQTDWFVFLTQVWKIISAGLLNTKPRSFQPNTASSYEVGCVYMQINNWPSESRVCVKIISSEMLRGKEHLWLWVLREVGWEVGTVMLSTVSYPQGEEE